MSVNVGYITRRYEVNEPGFSLSHSFKYINACNLALRA